jgi:hypothetical protein
MREGVPRAAERDLHAHLKLLRDRLRDERVIDRDLAALLVELLVTSWAATLDYPEPDQTAVSESVALVGEAIMAALTPDEMPPAPSDEV